MKMIQQTMKTKIILLALVATFAMTLFSSCSEIDCDDEIKPTTECEAESFCKPKNKANN